VCVGDVEELATKKESQAYVEMFAVKMNQITRGGLNVNSNAKRIEKIDAMKSYLVHQRRSSQNQSDHPCHPCHSYDASQTLKWGRRVGEKAY